MVYLGLATEYQRVVDPNSILFDTGLAVGAENPTFLLESGGPGIGSLPSLTIVYPDGGSSDAADLIAYNPIPQSPAEAPEDIEPCIYSGYLRKDPSVAVTVTASCSTGDDIYNNFKVCCNRSMLA